MLIFYEVLTVPTFLCGNETWTMNNKTSTETQAEEIKYSISVKRYTKLDTIKNDIVNNSIYIQ
jgi:hypothetical protein